MTKITIWCETPMKLDNGESLSFCYIETKNGKLIELTDRCYKSLNKKIGMDIEDYLGIKYPIAQFSALYNPYTKSFKPYQPLLFKKPSPEDKKFQCFQIDLENKGEKNESNVQ